MNNCVDAILNSISGIDESCLDAQWAVTESMINLSEKYSDMYNLSHDQLIFQENKFNDFMEYNPDEKMIKTILLAIPRLIMGLIALIRSKWNDYKMERKCKAIEDLIKQDIKNFRDVRDLNKVIDELNLTIPSFLKFQSDTNDANICYITLKVLDIKKINEYYEDMVNVFKRYANAVENNDTSLLYGSAEIRQKTHDVLDETITTNESSCRAYGNSSDNKEWDEIVDFRMNKHKKYIDEINRSATQLDKWVSSILNNENSSIDGFTKDGAKKMLDDAKKLHESFLNADTKILVAINDSINRLNESGTWLNNTSVVLNNYENMRKTKSEEAKQYHEDLMKNHPEAEKSELYKDWDKDDDE